MYRKGKTVRTQHISLKYTRRSPNKSYRSAVVVSRKVNKSAVARNRIRRRIYEIVRQADPQLTAQKDMVFTVFSDQAATMPAKNLRNLVEGLLKKTAETSPMSSEHR